MSVIRDNGGYITGPFHIEDGRETWNVVQRFARNADAATTLVDGCSDLSDVEAETLEAAVEQGYFNTPRDGKLKDIAEEFGVSSPAVSKNLRRAQRKINRHVVSALDDLR